MQLHTDVVSLRRIYGDGDAPASYSITRSSSSSNISLSSDGRRYNRAVVERLLQPQRLNKYIPAHAVGESWQELVMCGEPISGNTEVVTIKVPQRIYEAHGIIFKRTGSDGYH